MYSLYYWLSVLNSLVRGISLGKLCPYCPVQDIFLFGGMHLDFSYKINKPQLILLEQVLQMKHLTFC